MNITNISENSTKTDRYVNPFVSHFNLITIFLGVTGNTISFIIFRFHPTFKKMPSMVFLSFVAVSDTIALFEWNLNHFTILAYNIDIQQTNIVYCRLFNFAQYTSLQTSALILSFMCIDRYITVVAMPGSFLSKLPFRTNRTAFFWSSGIVLFEVCLNFHLLLFQGR